MDAISANKIIFTIKLISYIKSSAVLNYELCKKGYKFEKMTSNYKGIGNKISYKLIAHS